MFSITKLSSCRWVLFTGTAISAFLLLYLRLPPSHFPPLTMYPASLKERSKPVETPSRLLPHRYWKDRDERPEMYQQISCTRFPRLSDIHYAAASWQYLKAGNANVYVYGAYWDDRFSESLVRVLLYADVAPLPAVHCQLWYADDNAPTTVSSEVLYGWRRQWGGPIPGVAEPYILSCRARRHPPDPQTAPLAVSLVTAPCERAHNALNVQGAPGPGEASKQETPQDASKNASIGVCLKWVDYRRDVSAQLVEWAEAVRQFGASALYVHVVHCHPNVRKVLDYYSALGFAHVTELTHPPRLSGAVFPPRAQDSLDYRRELLPLNDCLYRALHRHALVAALDMDELIVPVRDGTWQQLVQKEFEEMKTPVDALVFANYYFLDGAQKDLDAPPPARILAHLWRARNPNPPGFNVKSFHNTSTVTAMHNHRPLSCGAPCRCRRVHQSVARLHHYRERCADDAADCPALHDVVQDLTMRRWSSIVDTTRDILREIDIPV